MNLELNNVLLICAEIKVNIEVETLKESTILTLLTDIAEVEITLGEIEQLLRYQLKSIREP